MTRTAFDAQSSASLLDFVPESYVRLDSEFRYTLVNRAAEELLGKARAELLGRVLWEVFPRVVGTLFDSNYRRVMAERVTASFEEFYEPWQRWYSIFAAPDLEGGIVVRTMDVTGRKRAEAYRELDREVLWILNQPGDLQQAMQRTLGAVNRLNHCDALGIRLQDGEDFPYIAQEGFSQEFLQTENTLVHLDADGGVCRDAEGHTRLECACGLVISGRTDPSIPLFTKGGSCWTNEASQLLEIPADADPRICPRNQCVHHGYASLALVPIRSQGKIVGLLQLNDRRRGHFSLDTIELLEGVAAHIGEALMRKRAEEALRKTSAALAEAEAHFHLMFNAISDAVFVFTVGDDGVASPFVEVNDAACRYLGYGREELLRMSFFDVVGPELNLDLRTLLQEVRAKGHVFYEACDVAKGGRRVPVEVSTRLTEFNGREALISSVRDVSDRREIEKKYRDIFEGAMEGIYRTSIDGNSETANPALARMLGYDSAEEYLATMHDSANQVWASPQERARFLEVLERQDIVRGYECQLKRKDGRVIWVSINSRRVCGADGRSLYNEGFMEDITERKRGEEERARLEAQFLQAQKMESVGRLAGGVAHDFNNLLTVINGYSQLLLAKLTVGDPLREKIEQIHKAGERAAGLTRQLLAYSRTQILQPHRLDLSCLVEDMRPMLERLVGEDIDVTVELLREGGVVHADPHQMEQVVMNLVVNARDAMPGVGTLLLRTSVVEWTEGETWARPESRAGRYVVLAVTDTGVGMDEETKVRIFEPFFTTKGTGEGTGLGLSMVQGIVAQSGGFIDVESEKGKGTTFQIYLPAAVGALAETEVPASGRTLGGRETVLVVEDQKEVRNYAVGVLKEFGYRAIPAENVGEALLLSEKKRFDLVLTDVVMPHASGKELAERLKKIQPEIRVLFMSGYAGSIVQQHGVLEGASMFIQKPFTPEDLAKKVRAAIDRVV